MSSTAEFALRNLTDKLRKSAGNPFYLWFYLRNYFLRRLESVEPDVYVVSYPKCGRTWLRMLLLNYFDNLEARRKKFLDDSILAYDGYPVLKFDHHQGNWVPAPVKVSRLSLDLTRYGRRKIVFLYRDPRDVLVSSWYHLRYREQIYDNDLSAFIRDDLLGIEKVVAFINLWLERSDQFAGFHLLAYESLHADCAKSLRDFLSFAGVPLEEDLIALAVEESSFQKMKGLEKSGSLREPWMRSGQNGADNAMKVRKGKIGGFREELSEADIAFVNNVIKGNLSPKLPFKL